MTATATAITRRPTRDRTQRWVVILTTTRGGTRVWCRDGELRYWGYPDDAHRVNFRHKCFADSIARQMYGRVIRLQDLGLQP